MSVSRKGQDSVTSDIVVLHLEFSQVCRARVESSPISCEIVAPFDALLLLVRLEFELSSVATSVFGEHVLRAGKILPPMSMTLLGNSSAIFLPFFGQGTYCEHDRINFLRSSPSPSRFCA